MGRNPARKDEENIFEEVKVWEKKVSQMTIGGEDVATARG